MYLRGRSLGIFATLFLDCMHCVLGLIGNFRSIMVIMVKSGVVLVKNGCNGLVRSTAEGGCFWSMKDRASWTTVVIHTT